ncbi:MAG: hypothetical protein FWH24_05215, partial [Oscillospiraceae bacterium]|nr:hypothetical protein [Oscillospiraceae bacterium]
FPGDGEFTVDPETGMIIFPGEEEEDGTAGIQGILKWIIIGGGALVLVIVVIIIIVVVRKKRRAKEEADDEDEENTAGSGDERL